MSKARLSTVAAGVVGRARLALVGAGIAIPDASARLAYVEAGVPVGPQAGMWTSLDASGDSWVRTVLFAYTGEDVLESPAPHGWRRVAGGTGSPPPSLVLTSTSRVTSTSLTTKG